MENEELYGIKPAVRDQLDADVFMILSELIEMLKDFNYEEERGGYGLWAVPEGLGSWADNVREGYGGYLPGGRPPRQDDGEDGVDGLHAGG